MKHFGFIMFHAAPINKVKVGTRKLEGRKAQNQRLMDNRGHSSDWLTEFGHRLDKVKYFLFQVAVFLGFLMYLWDKLKHDLGS